MMPRKHVVLPAALTVFVLILTGIFVNIGRHPNFLLDFPIISLDTTQLKDNILQSSNYSLPITDVLNLYFQTHCEGNYLSNRDISPQLKDVICSAPSSDVKFLPANIIHLQLINPNSSVQIQLPDNNFAHPLGEIQNKFKETYHAELHAAVTIYVATLCLEGIALIVALVSFFLVDVVWIFGGFSILTTILLLIGNIITTTLQNQTVTTINLYGNDVGIMGYHGTGLLVLIWAAFAVTCIATGTWGWGVLLSGSRENNSEASNKGRVYMSRTRHAVDIEAGGPLMLALKEGKVVEVDQDGRSIKLELDHVRESQIGLAL